MEKIVKFVAAAAMTAVGAYFREITVPFLVAVLVMACDWVSGVIAAGMEGALSSRIGIKGVMKKIAYALLIVDGMVVDFVVQLAADKLGVQVSGFCYFGMLVIMWIIVNELISILENLVRIGVPVPKFLEKTVNTLKLTTEQTGEKL